MKQKTSYTRMCFFCVGGVHSKCESEKCTCVCNEDDFRFVYAGLDLAAREEINTAQLRQLQPIN